MPANRKPGRDRIDLKYTAAFREMVAAAAQSRHVPLSLFVRDALIKELEQMGYKRAAIHATLDVPPEPKRRKRKEQS